MTAPDGDSGEKPPDGAGESESGQHTPEEAPYALPSGFAEPWGPPPPGYPPQGYPPPGGYPPPSSPYQQAPPAYGGAEGGYGQPPVGSYPVPGPAGGYGQRSETNTLAIASLIASCLGLLCGGIGAIVGIVLGTVALSQIKQTREEGYDLAVAGIIVGIAVMLAYLVLLAVRLH